MDLSHLEQRQAELEEREKRLRERERGLRNAQTTRRLCFYLFHQFNVSSYERKN